MEKTMIGKTCLVTGANSGMGKALSLALSGLGATMIMLCRDRGRGEAALSEIGGLTGNRNIQLLTVDLESQKSIRRGVEELKAGHKRLDVLINNAGAIRFEKLLTEDGIESTFAANYLGHFLLTNLLLDLLQAGAPSRIVNVSSEARARGRIDFDDLRGGKKYNPMAAYAQAKLACSLFTCELAGRLAGRGITANCFFPAGVVRTNLGNTDKGIFKYTFKILNVVLGPLFVPPEQGSRAGLYLATSEEASGVSGKCFVMKKNGMAVDESCDRTVAARLWEVSERLTGLKTS